MAQVTKEKPVTPVAKEKPVTPVAKEKQLQNTIQMQKS